MKFLIYKFSYVNFCQPYRTKNWAIRLTKAASSLCVSLVILFLLTGCGGISTTTLKISKILPVVCGSTPRADMIHMLPVEPIVVEDKSGILWMGLSSRHYEHIAINWQFVVKWMKQKNAIEKFYKSCIEDHNEAARIK